MRYLISIALLLMLLPGLTPAADLDGEFRRWLEQQVWPDARKQGVSRATFDAATAKIQLDWDLPDLVKPGSPGPTTDGQTEFGNPSRYFKPGNIDFLLAKAKPLEQTWAKTLAGVEKRYGVPRHILLAIWGKESAFGQAQLPHDAIQALASEAFAGARKEVFYPELLAALRIIDQEHLSPGSMKSSWAGALGHPQFMPSKFLQYAVDFDGDGKRDIWNSVPDVLASIANFLRQHGWKPDRGWGYEVEIPAAVSCAGEGPDQGKPIAEWQRLGIKRVGGQPIPPAEYKRQGMLLFPAGRHGPSFLVSENFYVLKDYNESDLYALFIGHLADRLQGGAPFVGQWRDVNGFKRGDVRAMQQQLERQGHDVGSADGLVGFKTRRSIGRWQERQGQTASCFPDATLIRKIR